MGTTAALRRRSQPEKHPARQDPMGGRLLLARAGGAGPGETRGSHLQLPVGNRTGSGPARCQAVARRGAAARPRGRGGRAERAGGNPPAGSRTSRAARRITEPPGRLCSAGASMSTKRQGRGTRRAGNPGTALSGRPAPVTRSDLALSWRSSIPSGRFRDNVFERSIRTLSTDSNLGSAWESFRSRLPLCWGLGPRTADPGRGIGAAGSRHVPQAVGSRTKLDEPAVPLLHRRRPLRDLSCRGSEGGTAAAAIPGRF